MVGYFGQLLDGVEAAHLHGACHRDLKPENVLFDEKSDTLVIADFGIAHFEEEDLHTAVETRTDARLANFLYAAPEQRTRETTADTRADIYALGLILNEMFTGVVPHGTGFRRIADVAPDFGYLDVVVEAMIQQDREKRFSSIDLIKRDIMARSNEVLVRQRLNTLKTEIIPEVEVDDPVVNNPIKIKSVDYNSGLLIFTLTAPPPPNWIMEFKNPQSSFNYIQGKAPTSFDFNGDKAVIPFGSQDNAPQVLVNHMNSYVESANKQYKDTALKGHRDRIADERLRHQNLIAEEERRLKILGSIEL